LEELDDEKMLASAVAFLAVGQEHEQEASATLLACTVKVYDSGSTWWVGNELQQGINIHLSGPRTAYEIICDVNNPIRETIRHAFDAILPEGTYLDSMTASAEIVNIDPDWRSLYLDFLKEGKNVSNQAVDDNANRMWNNLRFRSESEVKIAEALDRAGVLFLPNCKARLNTPQGRRNHEADFIICHRGKWGMLEVDGEPFHPPTRTVEDHRRDRYFKEHGMPLVEHFDATECYNKPDDVVSRFLKLLENTRA
jgi:very-short-patch-repair endonuclease